MHVDDLVRGWYAEVSNSSNTWPKCAGIASADHRLLLVYQQLSIGAKQRQEFVQSPLAERSVEAVDRLL